MEIRLSREEFDAGQMRLGIIPRPGEVFPPILPQYAVFVPGKFQPEYFVIGMEPNKHGKKTDEIKRISLADYYGPCFEVETHFSKLFRTRALICKPFGED